MGTLHIHLDEAGDWNFHPKGSKYFILTAAWTFEPRQLAEDLSTLRFGLLRNGESIEGFHAAPDKQSTRNAVVATMLARTSWTFGAVVIEKSKVNPVIRDPGRFYPRFAGALLRFIFRGGLATTPSGVLVYTDTLPINTHAKREGTLKAIKTVCAAELQSGARYHAYTHCHESNAWIQVADYCCWGIQRKWEKGDPRTYDQLKPRLLAPELDVTAGGDGTTYY